MVLTVLRVAALASVLNVLVERLPPVTAAGFNRFPGRAGALRRLQESSVESSGCQWGRTSCNVRGAYYAQTGAFYELDILVKELDSCQGSSPCDAGNCKKITVDEKSACVNSASEMDAQSATRFLALLDEHDDIQGFHNACPLTDALDGNASEECRDGWGLFVQVTGCESCKEDLLFFKNQLDPICRQLQDQSSCASKQGTQRVGKAICSRAKGGVAENADGQHAGTKRACADAESSAEEGRRLSTAAVAGIAIAAIVATLAIAALIAWAILRSPRARNSKKRGTAATAVPPAPGADPSPHGMHPGAPYGAPGMPHQPPNPYAYGHMQPPPHVHAGPTGPGGAPGGMPRMVPTDVYPSAAQYMTSGTEPAGSAGGDFSFYGGSAYGAPPAYGAGSAYGGSAYGGGSTFGGHEGPPAMQAGDLGDIARLPARDVLVKQVANSGDPAHMFSIGTRAAWDATAAGTMPAPTTTGTSKPEDVLEAQLDFVAHQLGGTLLQDSRVGAWVIAAGLQQRISSRSAVVFVHSRGEQAPVPVPAPNAGGLCALKFFFLKDDFDRNVAASQAPELKELMPVVERVEGDPSQLKMPSLPSPLNVHALPPLIINERGEALDEHVARTQPNFVSSLSIMIQLAQVIERLHSSGWVHRDLKPSNCLFLAQPARWAFIDWACAAKAGAPADVSFSLYYAPPETVLAYKTGQGQMHAHPSADVWSLGVMAWELFTGRKFYGPAPDLQYVVKVLAGEQLLPSEIELPPDIKKRLGNSMFRATFLSMLHRDPQQRPSMRQLLTSWESFFSQTRPN